MPVKVDNNISCKLTVDGAEYAVSTVEVVLGVNTIPKANLVLAPFKEKVMKPELASFIKGGSQEALQKAAQNSAKCELIIKMPDSSVDLKLKDWVIQQVGVATNSANSVTGIPIVIYHPAIELARIYLGCFGTITMGHQELLSETNKFLDNVATALDDYNTKITSSQASVLSSFRPMFDKVSADLVYGREVLNKVITSEVVGPKDIIGSNHWLSTATNSIGDKTLWYWLIYVFSSYGLQTIPDTSDYSAPLKVVPVSPWAKPVLTIADTQVSAIGIPTFAVEDPAGVAVTLGPDVTANGAVPTVTKSEGENSKSTVGSGRLLCYPTTPIKETTGGYNFKQIALPPWLRTASVRAKAEVPTVTDNVDKNIGSEVGRATKFESKEDTIVNGYVSKWLEEAFNLTKRANNLASVTCHPSATLQSGKLAVPGTVVAVGDNLFRYHVTSVVHIFSVPSRQVYSRLSGGHYRDRPLDLIPEGTKNKLYE